MQVRENTQALKEAFRVFIDAAFFYNILPGIRKSLTVCKDGIEATIYTIQDKKVK